MTLINTTEFPPDGYTYFEPSINWRWSRSDALNNPGLEVTARNLQMARAQNPTSGLDPNYDACLEAVKQYTCRRFANNPRLLAKFCGNKIVSEAAQRDASQPHRRGGCASCGRRK